MSRFRLSFASHSERDAHAICKDLDDKYCSHCFTTTPPKSRVCIEEYFGEKVQKTLIFKDLDDKQRKSLNLLATRGSRLSILPSHTHTHIAGIVNPALGCGGLLITFYLLLTTYYLLLLLLLLPEQ